MAPQPGQTLLHYRLTEKIGEGGMGVVWKAVDTNLGREVAIKVLPEAFLKETERLERFDREARLLASLNHPNIATVHGLHEQDDVKFLAMEFVTGEDLAERLHRGPLPLDEALEIARCVALALETAHDSGVIHRDLKPANIRIAADGQVKVLDFGLAKLIAPEAASGSSASAHSPTVTSLGTVAGVILGTAAYMSPEQARGKPVDRRADVWAFGCVLFEMLTGQKPFTGETITDIIAAVVTREPPWDELPVSTPRPIRRLLERCLRKNPPERLHHAADARLEIADAMQGGDEAEDAPAPSTRRPARELLGWLVAVLALVALLVLGLKDRGEPRVSAQAYSFTISQPAGGVDPPVISPDGRQLVYRKGGQLWLRALDQPEPRRLESTEGGLDPFWSPDNRSIGFFADGKLKRVAIDGGPPETLVEIPGGWATGSQAADGTILVEVTETLDHEGWYVLGPGARSLSKIRAFPNDRPIGPDKAYPGFLPDGRHFLFTHPHGGQPYLQVGSIDSEEVKLLAPAGSRSWYAEPGYVLYVRESALLAQPFDPRALELTGDPVRIADNLYFFAPTGNASFSVSQEGTLVFRRHQGDSRLKWFDREGHELETILEPAAYRTPRVSPDGRRAAVPIRDTKTGTTDIWLVDLERQVPTRLTSSPRSEMSPCWSPDSSRLALSADWDGPPNVYVVDLQGGTPEELVAYDRKQQYAGSWTPDGRRVLYQHDDETMGSNLWMIDLASGDREQFLATEFDERNPTLSPDGGVLAYRSNAAGRADIYLQSFPTGKNRTRLTVEGGENIRWRGDGKELFYYARHARSLMAVSVAASGSNRFEVGEPVPLFRIDPGSYRGYDIAPDGQRFLVNLAEPGADSPPVNVIVDWTRLLEQ